MVLMHLFVEFCKCERYHLLAISLVDEHPFATSGIPVTDPSGCTTYMH